MGTSEGEKREGEAIFEATVTKNFPIILSTDQI